jgi:hypothetical protein
VAPENPFQLNSMVVLESAMDVNFLRAAWLMLSSVDKYHILEDASK